MGTLNCEVKYLKDCKVGDKVRLWCIGWNAWDDVLVKILNNGVSTLIKVEYQSGRTAEFVSTTECRVEIAKEVSNEQ